MNIIIADITVILFVWAFLFIAIVSIGFGLLRRMGAGRDALMLLTDSFWVGWSLVILGLQIWHLFWPINQYAAWVFAAITIIGVILNFREVWAAVQTTKLPAFIWVLLFVFTVWIAKLSLNTVTPYDAGLYHLQAIQWLAEHSIVPGLGNLHGRLAFNNSGLLYMALLDAVGLKMRSYHLAYGLFYVILFVYLLNSLRNLLSKELQPRPCDFYMVAVLPFIVFQCIAYSSSTSTDVPASVVITLAGYYFLSVISLNNSANVSRYYFFILMLLCALGVTLKLSILVFCAITAGVVIVKAITGGLKEVNTKQGLVKILLTIALLPMILVTTWAVRGIVLSGYPAYPSTAAGFEVEWKIPQKTVEQELMAIKSWGRRPYANPNDVLNDWSWVKPWFKKLISYRFLIIIPVIISAACILWMIYCWRLVHRSPTRFFIFSLPVLFSLIYWFTMAPDIRFLFPLLWYLMAGATALFPRERLVRRPGIKQAGVLFLAIGLTVAGPVYHLRDKLLGNYDLNASVRFTQGLPVKTVMTRSRLTLWTPQQGDQCWDCPVPCTPYPNDRLKLRVPGELGSGFMIDTR